MQTISILNTINIVLIIAVAQGLLITILLFHKYSTLYPNRFLGLLMLIFSLSLIHIYLGEQELYEQELVDTILTSVIFLLGPLHFLYTKYLIHQPRKFMKIEMLHFTPAIVFIIFILLVSNDWLPRNYGRLFLNEQDSGLIFINWAFVIQVLVYYSLSIRELKWYSWRIKDVFSSIEPVRLHWLRLLTYLGISIILIFLVENILNLFQINITNFHLSSVLGAIYVYAMGYLGISKTYIFKDAVMEEITQDLPDDYSSQKEIKAKYERSGLSRDQAQKYAEHLIELMEDKKVYLDSQLTLLQLAEMLSISPHHLSEIINGHLNQKFFDLINQYRVNHVIKDFTNEKKRHLTILGIGLEAGFNSKTTFNTIFKKFTGKTPSEYRAGLLQTA